MNNSIRVALLLLFAPAALSASSVDRSIEATANASYNYRTVLAQRVSIHARNGIIVLTGTVEDAEDKALAGDTIAHIPGVEIVLNDVTVKPTVAEFSDAWIALKVRSRLLVKARVSAAATTVAVLDGVVTLGGTADTAAQRELTAVYAREIESVKSVTNDMVVNDAAPGSPPAGEIIDDASITSQVRCALLTEKATRGLKPRITTSDGVIAISGEAGSAVEKSLITKLAEDVRGVKSVENRMVVKG